MLPACARVVEVTDGDNGWHLHDHALLCSAARSQRNSWPAGRGTHVLPLASGVGTQGVHASGEHGWDLRHVQLEDRDLTDYFTKIAHEVTGSHREVGGRRGGRTPMQLLADGGDTYEESALGAVVGVGAGLRGPAPAHLVDCSTRPAEARRAWCGGHRRRQRHGGAGCRQPSGAHPVDCCRDRRPRRCPSLGWALDSCHGSTIHPGRHGGERPHEPPLRFRCGVS
jgi:hypothetical protein